MGTLHSRWQLGTCARRPAKVCSHTISFPGPCKPWKMEPAKRSLSFAAHPVCWGHHDSIKDTASNQKRFTKPQVGNIAGVRHGVVTDGLETSEKGCCGVGGQRVVIQV
jgi:hypothetical protein